MKKTTILVVCLFIVGTKINCQITKGNWMLGGNAAFSSTVSKSDAGQKTMAFNILLSPDIGYFFANNVSTGLKIGIGKQGSKSTGTSKYSTFTDANFGPFIRYYLLPVDNSVNILLEGSYQYGYIAGDDAKTKKNTFSLIGGPVVYFNSSAGLEFLIGYSSYKYVGFAGQNNIFQVGLGLQVHLEKK